MLLEVKAWSFYYTVVSTGGALTPEAMGEVAGLLARFASPFKDVCQGTCFVIPALY